MTDPIPLACDLTAIDAQERDGHITTVESLLQRVAEVRDLPDGYALRLFDDPTVFIAAAEFITRERLCCPFFNFALEAEAGRGPVWLKLTGGEGVKDFLRDNFIPLVALA